jgi:hypothetical protein
MNGWSACRKMHARTPKLEMGWSWRDLFPDSFLGRNERLERKPWSIVGEGMDGCWGRSVLVYVAGWLMSIIVNVT